MEKTAATKKKSWTTRLFVISLAVLILFTVINWGVITGWGAVDITRITVIGDDGKEYSALVYVPSSATDETPAPALLCFHGNNGNARNHESWAVEFARRGFVVISPDLQGAGDGEMVELPYTGRMYQLQELGLSAIPEAFYRYAMDLPIVDSSKIISSGHSIGCAPAFAMAAEYGAAGVMLASGLSGSSGDFVTTFLTEEQQEYCRNYTGNYLFLVGSPEITMENLKEKAFEVISARPDFQDLSYEDFEIGQLYGSFEDGNAVEFIMEEGRLHEAAFVDSSTIEHLLDFAMNVIGIDNVPNYIPADSQVWMYKDYIGLICMYLFTFFLVCLALFMIEQIPSLSIVRQPLPRNIGLRNVGLAISVIAALIVPIIVLKTGAFGLIDAMGTNGDNFVFPLFKQNIPFSTMIALNAVGFITFIIFIFTDGKKHKMQLCDLGLTTYGNNRPNVEYILKSILLAILVIMIGWSFITFQNEIFGTDLYAWFFGFKPVMWKKAKYYVIYILIWVVCFLLACITFNVERRLPSTGKEWLDILIAVVLNIALASGMLILIIRVYWNMQVAGVSGTFWTTWGADITRLWGMPVGMGVGVGGATLLYRKTGNNILAAVLMGTVSALTCVLYGHIRLPLPM